MVKQICLFFLICICCTGTAQAQDLGDLQIHGFVTQGVLYSSRNNLFTMETSNGSARWTDGAVSVSDPITDKLHVGIQFHVYQLGDLGGPNLQIDWATGDYHASDKARFVAGKVKTVYGLFNDSQDVDAVQLFVLLPESIYPIDNKSFLLSHYGGDYYGTMDIGKRGGKLSYRGFAGYRSLDLNGGYAKELEPDVGSAFSTGGGNVFGGDLRWQTPLRGVLVGVSAITGNLNGTAPTGSFHIPYATLPVYFAQFEKGKFMAATEFRRTNGEFNLHLNNVDPFPYPAPVIPFNTQSVYDDRAWYVMSTYRITGKLQGGAYYSHYRTPIGSGSLPANYSNDSVICGRYDINAYFYAKLEGHFIRGTALNYYVDTNPLGERNATNMLAAKVGFSF
jgi:hypothetical protein